VPPEHLADLGLVADEPVRGDDDEVFHLRPSNARAWAFWLSIQTQWTWCGAGVAGMARTGIPARDLEAELRLQRVPQRRQHEMRTLVRAMEVAALEAYREQLDRALSKR